MSANDPSTYADDGTDATRWMLPEDAPEPQVFEDTPRKKSDKRTPSETHTGTDPLGRAIGPAEDHEKIKKVRDSEGKVITPKADTKAAARPDLTPEPPTTTTT